LDSIPSYVFHQIFDRASHDVDLQGCRTAIQIENRLRTARHHAKKLAKTARNANRRKRWWYQAEQLDKLIEHNFAGRAIHETHRNPRGLVALTLLYGRKTARERIEAQKRARGRPRFDFKRAKEIPALRRKRVFRRRFE
jgi:hypothetical protein